MATVYRISDIETGQVYIGQTGQPEGERRKQHVRDLKRGKHHNKALQTIFNSNPRRLLYVVMCEVPFFRVHDIERRYIDVIERRGGCTMNVPPNQNPYWLR